MILKLPPFPFSIQHHSPLIRCHPRHQIRSRGITRRNLTILALESSADDSCCAIVNDERKILSNIVMKQHVINAKYGGIHPLKAQEAHMANIPIAISKALSESQMKLDDLDGIADTRGPGMYGPLSVGATSARALAAISGKPLYGIHHMQAHALTPLLTEDIPPTFPFLVLLVSGGHTQLVLAEGINQFQILANTIDNSVGDVFDKVARMLELPISPNRHFGATLEYYASLPSPSSSIPTTTKFPSPLLHQSISPASKLGDQVGPVPFSFAGLYAHSSRVIEAAKKANEGKLKEGDQKEISRLFQEAAVGHLVQQVKRSSGKLVNGNRHTGNEGDEGGGSEGAVNELGLVVSGGVASNQYLRKQLSQMMTEIYPRSESKLYFPPMNLCTDNAAMIAWAAILRIQQGAKPEGYDLPIRPKWSLEDLYDDIPS